ncbi:MAG: hypothetical protein V4585_12510 [Bacteroidota bacterium]
MKIADEMREGTTFNYAKGLWEKGLKADLTADFLQITNLESRNKLSKKKNLLLNLSNFTQKKQAFRARFSLIKSVYFLFTSSSINLKMQDLAESVILHYKIFR